jgi:3-oxoadipate enol-lactonase
MPYTTNDGTRIYWEEHGSGDPLLLIMGLGYPHQMWHRTVPVVSARYRTILFDNRGVGESDVPDGAYPIATMADDARCVLDAAGVDTAHVYGISMGGMIAQEFALRYPARVSKLVLGCTAPGGPKVVRAEAAVNEVLMNRGNLSMEEAMEATVPIIYDAHTPRERIDEDMAIRRKNYPTAAGYTNQLMGILAWQSWDRLAAIAAPTLVIHGASDRLVPPGNGELIAGKIPGAKWVLIPDASHIYPTDHPERANAEVMDFLAS